MQEIAHKNLEQPTLSQYALPVFQQDWWIGIALADREYHESIARRDDRVVGRLPYAIRKNKIGIRRADPFPWTHLSGPSVDAGLSQAEKADVLHQLISQLPGTCCFRFDCPPCDPASAQLLIDAFGKFGFQHRTQTTYTQTPDVPDIYERVSSKRRNQYRKAEDALDITDIDPRHFRDFYEANLIVCGKKSYADLDIAQKLMTEGLKRGQVRLIAARKKNSDGTIPMNAPYDAALACAWDNRRYYYWMATRRRHVEGGSHKEPHEDAQKILAFTAIRDAKRRNLVFDADGVSTDGTEHLYKAIFRLPAEEKRHIFARDTTASLVYSGSVTRARKLTKWLLQLNQ